MKVLLLAPMIDPTASGEELSCFELVTELIKHVDIELIALTAQNRDYEISDYFPETKVHCVRSWSTGKIHERLDALAKPNYIKFQAFAAKLLRDRIDLNQFSCAHQCGPLALRYASPLRNTALPYIIGPLGGSLSAPAGFDQSQGDYPWYYRLRDLDGLRFRSSKPLRQTYSRAEFVVGAAQYVEDLLSHMTLKGFRTQAEVAAPTPAHNISDIITRRFEASGPVKFLTVGRLVPSKGHLYALDALRSVDLQNKNWTWDILGDGPERETIQSKILNFGLAEKVTMHGQISIQDVNAFYDRSDIFLFPSIREPSGRVVFEAMSRGLPMIVANYGGPEGHVTKAFGIKVDVDSEEHFVTEIARAATELIENSDRRREMAYAAVKEALEKHSIEARAKFFASLYKEVSTKQVV
ncbi:MAG: glycosyltransferase family 4 protein [Pseudomonadota bacterium]